MLNGPFSPWPSFTQEEADAVSRVVLSNRVNYWTGQEGRAFEEEFAGWVGARHAIALANGTNALEVALEALEIGPGDEVITTPRTFLASVSAIVKVGAVPVFADVDRDTQNITAATIAPHITKATRAIIAVHLAGQPCDMDPIMALASEHRLKVIEDCAQAHGARYRGRSVGSIGDVGCWSFCQDKIMTTAGEGGMVTTSNDALWRKMWSIKDHGKSYAAVYETAHPPGFRWLHESFGSNYRMTEMQAVVGRIQLARMPEWTRSRTDNATKLREAAASVPAFRVPPLVCAAACKSMADCRCVHAHYKCYVFVEPAALAAGWDRDRIMNEIVHRGVPCFSGSCSEVYREKAFEQTPWRPQEPLPVAQELGATSLMFLVHPTLTAAEIDKACATIMAVGQEACRKAR